RRTFNQKSEAKTNNFSEKVNTANVNNVTTVGPKAVVSAVKRKQKSRRKQRKEIKIPLPSSKIPNEERLPITSNDLLPSGKDRIQLNELMILCTNLQKQVLNLEEAKTAQAKEIASLKKRVKKLEHKRKSRTLGLKRLRKVRSTRRVESLTEASLGDQEDASKQGRMIDNIDQDVEITLVDDNQGRINEEDIFGVNDLDGNEVVVDFLASEKVKQSIKVVENEVSTADPVTTVGEVVTTVAKPKAITTTAIIVTAAGIRPKAKGIVMQEPSERPAPTPIDSSQQSSKAKDKGKAKMIEPEKPLKRNYQIMIDEEVARNLKAQMQAELEKEERLARQKEKEANIALIEAFVPMDTELVKGSKKAVEGSKKAEESSSKRARSNLEQEDAKRQMIEAENEYAELKR
nr:hypothetical protein [Tanacetum cinerariifolium]